jgi:hypothetical protein
MRTMTPKPKKSLPGRAASHGTWFIAIASPGPWLHEEALAQPRSLADRGEIERGFFARLVWRQ